MVWRSQNPASYRFKPLFIGGSMILRLLKISTKNCFKEPLEIWISTAPWPRPRWDFQGFFQGWSHRAMVSRRGMCHQQGGEGDVFPGSTWGKSNKKPKMLAPVIFRGTFFPDKFKYTSLAWCYFWMTPWPESPWVQLPCDFEDYGVPNRSSFSRKIHQPWRP